MGDLLLAQKKMAGTLVVRDASGNLTGVFEENAMDLIDAPLDVRIGSLGLFSMSPFVAGETKVSLSAKPINKSTIFSSSGMWLSMLMLRTAGVAAA